MRCTQGPCLLATCLVDESKHSIPFPRWGIVHEYTPPQFLSGFDIWQSGAFKCLWLFLI